MQNFRINRGEKMNNSPLVVHTRISPNSNHRRERITKITIHHVAGNLSIEAIGNVFASSERRASSNYGIGSDGRVGMYVEEKDRAWTSSNRANDEQAVTIEVANNSGAPNWSVSDKAFNTLIELCVCICKRNGIKKLVFTGRPDGSLTHHRMFAATTCPGPFLLDRFHEICSLVNARLRKEAEEEMTQEKFDEMMNVWLSDQNNLPPSQWATDELGEEFERAVSMGITDGARPQGIPRRQELIAMIVRVFDKISGGKR